MTRVKCSKCGGTGKMPLSETLQAMLADVNSFPGCSAPWHAARNADDETEISVTAYNNRLEELRALGLVRRVRRGREWRYFAMKEKR